MSKVKVQELKNYFIKHKKTCRHIAALTSIFVVYIGFCLFISNSAFMKIDKYINTDETGQVVGELKNGDVITFLFAYNRR